MKTYKKFDWTPATALQEITKNPPWLERHFAGLAGKDDHFGSFNFHRVVQGETQFTYPEYIQHMCQLYDTAKLWHVVPEDWLKDRDGLRRGETSIDPPITEEAIKNYDPKP